MNRHRQLSTAVATCLSICLGAFLLRGSFEHDRPSTSPKAPQTQANDRSPSSSPELLAELRDAGAANLRPESPFKRRQAEFEGLPRISSDQALELDYAGFLSSEKANRALPSGARFRPVECRSGLCRYEADLGAAPLVGDLRSLYGGVSDVVPRHAFTQHLIATDSLSIVTFSRREDESGSVEAMAQGAGDH